MNDTDCVTRWSTLGRTWETYGYRIDGTHGASGDTRATERGVPADRVVAR